MSQLRNLMLCGVVAALSLCQACEPGQSSGTAKNTYFVGGDGVFSKKFIEIGGQATDGAYIITPFINDTSNKRIKRFSDDFTKEFKNSEPDAWAALTYDAVHTYAAVMKKVGPDRQKIRDALAAMNSPETGYPGVTGVTYFNGDGDCVKPALVAEVKDGAFITSKTQVGEVKIVDAADAGKKEEAKGEPILLGVAGPYTGTSQAFGDMIKKGSSLAIKEINASGGINGRPLKAVFGDDEGVNSKAANVAQDLASNKGIVAIVGHFNSTCSLAAKRIYKANKIAMLSPGSTNVDVCKGNEWAFRNLYRDDFQGYLIADFLKDKLNCKKVAVFFDNDDYGAGLKKFFVERAKKIGLEVVAEIPFNRESTTDYNPLVTKAKYKKPDAIFVAGLFEQSGLIAKAARKAGLLK